MTGKAIVATGILSLLCFTAKATGTTTDTTALPTKWYEKWNLSYTYAIHLPTQKLPDSIPLIPLRSPTHTLTFGYTWHLGKLVGVSLAGELYWRKLTFKSSAGRTFPSESTKYGENRLRLFYLGAYTGVEWYLIRNSKGEVAFMLSTGFRAGLRLGGSLKRIYEINDRKVIEKMRELTDGSLPYYFGPTIALGSRHFGIYVHYRLTTIFDTNKKYGYTEQGSWLTEKATGNATFPAFTPLEVGIYVR